MYVAMSSNYLY